MKQINPYLGGLSGGSFLPPMLQRDYEFENRYNHLNCIHILHLVYTTSLSDLRFNKKFEQKKKSLYNSISKSIYVDTYYLLFLIIISECDVLSPSTKFSSLHHEKVVVLRV